MRRFIVSLAVLGLAPAMAANSQDSLPPVGQPGQQTQQQVRQTGGQDPRGFSSNPAGAAPGAAADPAYMQQVSYGLGRNFAMQLRDNEIEVDFQAMMAGISDALRGAQPKWSDQQLEATLERFSKEMQQKAMVRMQQMGQKNHQESDAFLAQNSKVQGVQTTPSGLQFRVLKQGQPSGASPVLGDKVVCHYKGTLLNGTEFDSSARSGKPAEFTLSDGPTGLIAGWTEALQKMHVGDKWQLFVPPKLAYDMRPPRGAPIEPGSLLVFEIELLDVVKK